MLEATSTARIVLTTVASAEDAARLAAPQIARQTRVRNRHVSQPSLS